MSIWEVTEQFFKAKLIKNSLKRGECIHLEQDLERYLSDPMSDYAPSECLNLMKLRHYKSCEVCQTLKESK